MKKSYFSCHYNPKNSFIHMDNGKGSINKKPKFITNNICLSKRYVVADVEKYIDFLKRVFKQPRQTLFNNLRKQGAVSSDKLDLIFNKLGFDKKIRPQNLNQEKLLELFQSIMVY